MTSAQHPTGPGMPPPAFVSIVSANYLAYAVTLMQSLREHHPDSPRYVILADERRDDLDLEPDLFTLVPVAELSIPHFEHFAFRYSVLEFNTAVKAFAISWVHERHPSVGIVYLDPDIYVLAPLAEVTDRISGGALAVVTPHLTAPIADDKYPDELAILRVGSFNLGFIALGPHPLRSAVVKWWEAKLERSAFVDLEAGMFNDQKWIDLLPGLFPDVAILRHPGYNLAYWNLAHRPVSVRADGALLANGVPVSFVHFSGVSVRNPQAFSVHQTRFDADSIGALRPLYLRYLELLRANGYDRYIRMPYSWGRLRDGSTITPEMRAVFRYRFDVGQRQEQVRPFAIPKRLFEEELSLSARATRQLLHLYPRVRGLRPVRYAMNRLRSPARTRIRLAMQRRATSKSLVEAGATSRATPVGFPTTRPTGLEELPRANIIGYLRGEFGVAEAARALVRAARAAGVEVALVNVSAAGTAREDDERFVAEFGDGAPHPINVICVNADQTPFVHQLLGNRIVEGRYNIGYWAWELSKFPEAWYGALDLVDEIWVPSEFVRAAVAAVTRKPVIVIPESVDVAISTPPNRTSFGLTDDSFVFLFSFDFASFVERKNPAGVVAAFREAFDRDRRDVVLYLKCTNGDKNPRGLAQLRRAIHDDDRIRLEDRFITRQEMNDLLQVANTYVSLHRSEGFGLGLAESMALGKPVIATGYSGSLEFMNPGNSALVGYSLIEVGRDEYPFADGQVWAEPDIEQAAYYMRRMTDDADFGAGLGRQAAHDVQSLLGPKAIGARLSQELRRVQLRSPLS